MICPKSQNLCHWWSKKPFSFISVLTIKYNDSYCSKKHTSTHIVLKSILASQLFNCISPYLFDFVLCIRLVFLSIFALQMHAYAKQEIIDVIFHLLVILDKWFNVILVMLLEGTLEFPICIWKIMSQCSIIRKCLYFCTSMKC